VWISQRPASEGQLRAYPRHVLTPWQLVGDPHDDFADISIGDRQLALLLQLCGDRGDFLSGQPAS
jgi:hypothetical protein